LNTWNINLDVSKSTAYNAPVIIGQGDKAGTTILATIFDHGTQCDLTGMTAKFMLRSGGGYFEDASCTVSSSTITYAMDEEHAASVAGMAQAYFAIYQGTTHVYSTSRFDVKVLRAASSGADPAQSYSDDIVAATQAARAAADAAEEAMEDIGTAVSDAQQAAASASQAVSDAQQAISDADTAKQAATSAANAATTAAASAASAANNANTATNAANSAATAANDAASRAEDAIDAMGDISEIAVPLMSSDVRGGAKLGDGLTLTDGALGIDPAPHESTGEVRGSIASLTAKGHAEQDGTPTPDSPVDIQTVTGHTVTGKTGRYVDMEVQGKNLLDVSKSVDGKVVNSTTGAEAGNASYRHSDYIPVTENTTYYMSNGLGIGTMYGGAIYDANKQYLRGITFTGANNQSGPFDTGADAAYVILNYFVPTHARYVAPPQLELGSVAHDYEPYYHTTTPIPLPSRGWVASLPDGTADVLTLDGAGKVEWELGTEEVVLDGSETWYIAPNGIDAFSFVINQTVLRPSDSYTSSPSLSSHYPFASIHTVQQHNVIALSIDNANGNIVIAPTGQTITAAEYKAFLAQNPVTVLYPLATPITEECGYVEDWPTDIPEGAVITIPELDALGVKYYVGGAAVTLAHQWYERARSEYEDRITALEAAVSEIIAG